MTRLIPFWMVCRAPTHAGSKTEPRWRYPSREEAMAAAADLARTNDAAFVVLEAVATVSPRLDTTPSLL